VRLYVCWGTYGGDWHPCHRAHDALRDAGYDFEVVRTYGWRRLPDALNPPQRHEVKRLSGDTEVPVLVLDDATVISGSQQIVDWARRSAASSRG